MTACIIQNHSHILRIGCPVRHVRLVTNSHDNKLERSSNGHSLVAMSHFVLKEEPILIFGELVWHCDRNRDLYAALMPYRAKKKLFNHFELVLRACKHKPSVFGPGARSIVLDNKLLIDGLTCAHLEFVWILDAHQAHRQLIFLSLTGEKLSVIHHLRYA